MSESIRAPTHGSTNRQRFVSGKFIGSETWKIRSSSSLPDGTFGAYISRPATLPAPVVVVLQELFGVNADIRATCDELAAQGYTAIAPDLFWRQEPGVDLDVRSEADWQHGLRLYGAYDRDAGARDIAETIRTAVKLPESVGKVALQGYCLGALMAFITAARHDVNAAVAYHGGDTEKYLGEVSSLRAPLLMHLGEEDEFIPKTGAGADQSGAEKKAERNRLQLPRSASRVFPTQWGALQCRRGSTGERTNTRISQSIPAVTYGRCSANDGLWPQ